MAVTTPPLSLAVAPTRPDRLPNALLQDGKEACRLQFGRRVLQLQTSRTSLPTTVVDTDPAARFLVHFPRFPPALCEGSLLSAAPAVVMKCPIGAKQAPKMIHSRLVDSAVSIHGKLSIEISNGFE
jgi:hypothetical protein